MRLFFRLIIGTLCFLFAFAFVSDVFPKSHYNYKDHYYRHGTDSTVWWAEAWASAYAGEDGYFRTWCHVGTGLNDYKGGAYQGSFHESAASASVNNDGPPSPYWSSSYIN